MNVITNLINPPQLNDVFTPGGQPSVTYVQRAHLGLEPALRKAVALATTIVSLTGATKAGKTVLCRSVMAPYEYVWIDGGQVKSEEGLWNKVCSELRVPLELKESAGGNSGQNLGAKVNAEGAPMGIGAKFEFSLGGSRLRSFDESRTYKLDTPSAAIEYLLKNGVTLIIDDFHYLADDVRTEVIKSLKGAVFRGLKVLC